MLLKTEGITLDSISLFPEERPLLSGEPLHKWLTTDFTKYQNHIVSKQDEALSPRLWNLPEIYRKKLTAFSENTRHEVSVQNRLADFVRYNFSNGMQISAKEILRHPLHKVVPLDLLPNGKAPILDLHKWPLNQELEGHFISRAVLEIEEITQALILKIAEAARRRETKLFLQSSQNLNVALPIEQLEFDPNQEVYWRVEIKENRHIEAALTLMSKKKTQLHFFASFALEPTIGQLIIHPWLREFNQLSEVSAALSLGVIKTSNGQPQILCVGETETKSILNSLRSRTLPIEFLGETRTVQDSQSLTKICFDLTGHFYLEHEARILGQKDFTRRGWTTTTAFFLEVLTKGIPYLLQTEAKFLAARSGTKREWDLKLLKHIGILQYMMTEVLSVHFDKQYLDGRIATTTDDIFQVLVPKVQSLLLAGAGTNLVREMSLAEICSKSVLLCFERFAQMVLDAAKTPETYFSEDGEIILEGLVEREFRLLFEILKTLATSSAGESFRRSRTGLLEKISNSKRETHQVQNFDLFNFPLSESEAPRQLHRSLEIVQPLILSQFQILVQGQALEQLDENEFQVDFSLTTESDNRQINWFELNPQFFLKGQAVDPDQLVNLGSGGVIEYAGKLYLVPQKQLPSLKKLEHFWLRLQRGKLSGAHQKSGSRVYELPKSQTLELLAMRATGLAIRGDKEWQELCLFYDNLGKEKPELELPAEMVQILKPYQKSGINWLRDLYHLKLGALLADDMGLGKTLQTLFFLEELRRKNKLGATLIVVPSSLVYNWQSEAQKFTPELRIEVFSSKQAELISKLASKNEPAVLIITYGLLMEHQEYLSQYTWNIAVFDEAQNLKNISARRTSAARSLQAQFKLCLTGTPLENHYGEFYSLIDLIVPGSLGPLDEFRRRYVNTETVLGEEILDLKLKVKPLLLRRTKREILDQLPEKHETKLSLAFEEKQKEIYRNIAISYNQRLQETMLEQGEASVQLQMLTALLRLRQACSDPASLPNVKYDQIPPKLEALSDSIEEITSAGESALVFTQFLQTLERAEKLLKKLNIPVFVLHGSLPSKQRQKILADFNATEKGAVLIMTLKTGGVGLNLTKASYVFHLEPWWNPSVENQATDRAYRLGQNKAVQVFRYIMHESLEEKIELLKARKDRKFQTLFSQDEKAAGTNHEIGPGSGALSKEDFEFLLGLKS